MLFTAKEAQVASPPWFALNQYLSRDGTVGNNKLQVIGEGTFVRTVAGK